MFVLTGRLPCVSAYVRTCVSLLPVHPRHLIATELIVSRGLDRPVFYIMVFHMVTAISDIPVFHVNFCSHSSNVQSVKIF